MKSPTVVFALREEFGEDHAQPLEDKQLAKDHTKRPSSAERGAILGIALGAVLWGGILVAFGVIKL